MKVLLVDDSAAIRNSFGELLAAVPAVTVVGSAEDAAGALRLIESLAPDLVVLDVQLRHGEHGMTVLQQVRQKHPGLLVVALSNFTWCALRNDLLAAGAAACFDKANEFMLARDWIASRAAVAAAAGSDQRV